MADVAMADVEVWVAAAVVEVKADAYEACASYV